MHDFNFPTYTNQKSYVQDILLLLNKKQFEKVIQISNNFKYIQENPGKFYYNTINQNLSPKLHCPIIDTYIFTTMFFALVLDNDDINLKAIK